MNTMDSWKGVVFDVLLNYVKSMVYLASGYLIGAQSNWWWGLLLTLLLCWIAILLYLWQDDEIREWLDDEATRTLTAIGALTEVSNTRHLHGLPTEPLYVTSQQLSDLHVQLVKMRSSFWYTCWVAVRPWTMKFR